MFPPWFIPPSTPGPWGQAGKGPAIPPGYRPPIPGGPLPAVSWQAAANTDPSHSAGGIPPDVRVVADLPASRPPDSVLPEGRTAWSPDGRYLLYVGGPGQGGEPGPLMLLDVEQPANPRMVAEEVFGGGLAWHPDGQSFVYTGTYQAPDGDLVATIYHQRLDDGQPVNLLPPEVTPPLKVAFIHRWLDDRTLAFDEGVGTGIRRTLLLDTAERKLIQTPGLVATFFFWAPPGNRLAGETLIRSSPSEFWIWDRQQNRFLYSPLPEEKRPLPGDQPFFEAWSPDGSTALISTWRGEPYTPGATPSHYRIDPATGQTDLVAQDAALAAWSGDWIAYVRFGPTLSLVMTRAADNQVLWSDDLGPPPPNRSLFFPWSYWPRFAPPYVAYRTTAGEWRVSRADRKEVRPLYRGESVDLLWSPDGRHIALLHTNETARLTVVANPLTPVRTPMLGILPRDHAAPHELPPGMTLEQALASAGNRVCLTGEGGVHLFRLPTPTSEGALPYPLVAVWLKLLDYPNAVFLTASEALPYGDVSQLIRGGQIRVCGITQGINPMLGPVLRVTAFPVIFEA